jgi:hypothetical protein
VGWSVVGDPTGKFADHGVSARDGVLVKNISHEDALTIAQEEAQFKSCAEANQGRLRIAAPTSEHRCETPTAR